MPIKSLGGTTTPDEFKANRRKYQGNEYITDLGLNWMDFQNRQYDPQLGRFLSIDPLASFGGQDMVSPYAAMGNTPESNVDPNGLIPIVHSSLSLSRLNAVRSGENDNGGILGGDWSHALGDWAAGGNFDIWGSLGDFGGSTATRVEAARARDKAEMDGGDMQNGTTEGGAADGGGTTEGSGKTNNTEAGTGDPVPQSDGKEELKKDGQANLALQKLGIAVGSSNLTKEAIDFLRRNPAFVEYLSTMTMESKISVLKDLSLLSPAIKSAGKIFVVTGAGISVVQGVVSLS